MSYHFYEFEAEGEKLKLLFEYNSKEPTEFFVSGSLRLIADRFNLTGDPQIKELLGEDLFARVTSEAFEMLSLELANVTS